MAQRMIGCPDTEVVLVGDIIERIPTTIVLLKTAETRILLIARDGCWRIAPFIPKKSSGKAVASPRNTTLKKSGAIGH